MTIDKRINFRGGGKYDTYQGGSKAPGSAESIPDRITYTSENIDSKPVTGNDYRRSENEFIDNFNQNEASRFEPTFFNRNYDPISANQFGSSNQPRNYGNAAMGGILSLITGNPLAGLAYKGYNFLKDKGPQTLNTFQDSPTLMDFYNNMQPTPINNTIDIGEKFNRTEGLSDVRPTPQIFEFDPTNFNTRNVATVNSFDEIDNQVAELTDKQKAFINNQKTAIELGAQTPQDIYTKITNPDYPIYDSGIFGYGEQEPTTVEEYNNYLQSIGINQRIV